MNVWIVQYEPEHRGSLIQSVVAVCDSLDAAYLAAELHHRRAYPGRPALAWSRSAVGPWFGNVQPDDLSAPVWVLIELPLTRVADADRDWLETTGRLPVLAAAAVGAWLNDGLAALHATEDAGRAPSRRSDEHASITR